MLFCVVEDMGLYRNDAILTGIRLPFPLSLEWILGGCDILTQQLFPFSFS